MNGPRLYARIAANGSRYHIVDPATTDGEWWLSYCGQSVPLDAVTEGEGLGDFSSPYITLCPNCKRAEAKAS